MREGTKCGTRRLRRDEGRIAARSERILVVRRREEGMALLVTVMVVIMIAAMAMAAIHNAGEEASGGRRTKTSLDALFAASAGIEMSRSRIAQGNLAPIDVTMPGNNQIRIQSRRRSQSAPQAIKPMGLGDQHEGNMINVGSAIGITDEMYQVNVTGSSPGGAFAEVESKVGFTGAGSGSGSKAGGGY
jgi:hypothetical protein